MKWMIASDIHGSAFYCSKLLAAYKREQARRLLLLGDILYHGPRNDLPQEYQPKKVISMLNSMKREILCVRGNCESEAEQLVLEFPVTADYCPIPLGERLLFAAHGHHYNPETPPPLSAGDILLNGHTHIPECREFSVPTELGKSNLIIYMNPGSISIPKQNSWHGYMTMEDGLFLWKDLDGQVQMQWRAEK